jgi:ABC-2 type transport system permease protein
MNNKFLVKSIAQLKREVLEYRWGLLYIPALLSALVVVCTVLFSYYWLYVRKEVVSSDFTINSAAMEFMYLNCAILLFFYFFILANYLSSCLYDDRKSKQILFWRSMPVSETMNVLIKILVVVFLVPTLILFMNAIMSIMGIAIAYFCVGGLNSELQIPFSSDTEGNIFVVILEIYRDNLLGMLFIAPFIGYLLMVSAWVKRFPMAIAFGVPMLVTFIDFLLGRLDLTIGVLPLWKLYGGLWMEIRSAFVLREVFEFNLELVWPLLISIVIGGVLVSISIWLRNNRYEI